MTPAWRSSVAACAAAVRAGEVSARDVAAATLEAIRDFDPAIRAFSDVDEGSLRDQAARLDARIASGARVGPLAGVPVAIKDLVDVRGLATSYGSAAFDPFVAQRDATAVRRLRAAGALIVGKVRTTAFAWSDRTAPTVNPLDPRLTTGGSSSGPAAAVASGQVLAALGSDTGGSIRVPASLCGIVGMKPTFGAVGRSGVLPGNWTLDTLGPLVRSSDDARLMLAALVGSDAGDPWAVGPGRAARLRRDLARPFTADPGPLRLGIVDEPLFEINDPLIASANASALDALGRGGVELIRFRLPDAAWVASTLVAIDLPDAAAIHTFRLRDRRDDFEPDLAALMRVFHLVPAALVARGHAMRHRISTAIAASFRAHRLDAIVAPTNPVPPIPIDDPARTHVRMGGEVERDAWALGRAVWLANVTGQPALTIPVTAGLPPVGLQLIGRPYGDARLLSIGAAVERMLRS